MRMCAFMTIGFAAIAGMSCSGSSSKVRDHKSLRDDRGIAGDSGCGRRTSSSNTPAAGGGRSTC